MSLDPDSRDARRLAAALKALDALMDLDDASLASFVRVAAGVVAETRRRAHDAGLSGDDVAALQAQGEALVDAPSPAAAGGPSVPALVLPPADVPMLELVSDAPNAPAPLTLSAQAPPHDGSANSDAGAHQPASNSPSDEPLPEAGAADEPDSDDLLDSLFDQLTEAPAVAIASDEPGTNDNEEQATSDAPAAFDLPLDALTPLDLEDDDDDDAFGEMPTTQDVDLGSVLRMHTRFEARDKVTVELGGRDELRELYTRDISRGGLFINTDDPPPIDTELSVKVQTPHGALELPSRVVHVLPVDQAAQMGTDAGVGVQFDNLSDDTISRLEHYINGVAMQLEAAATADLSGPAGQARKLMRAVERNELYDAVALSPEVEREVLRHRLDELRATFESAEAAADDAERPRFVNALRTVQRLSGVLLDDTRRLAYDFQHGHERVDERLASDDEAALARCRAVWRKVCTDRVTNANRLIREALAADKLCNYEEAATKAADAIVHDPFNPKLRRRAKQWANLEQVVILIRDEQLSPEDWLDLASQQDLSVELLRTLWTMEHPERMEEARELGSKAMQAEMIKRIDLALESAKAALALDPFNASLRQAINKWAEAA